MKKLLQIFLVIFAVCVTANAQTFSENFTGLTSGANLAGQSSWVKAGSGPELTVANATPLTYPGYASGGAEYVVMPTGTATTARLYKSIGTPKTNLAHSTFYYSLLLRLTGTTASSNGYFMSLGNSGTGTQYGAKLFARTSGAGYNIGLSKTSNTATFGASVLNLNQTYLVIVRYTFNNPGSGVDSLGDDEAYLWVNPIAKTEPGIGDAECIIPSGKGGTDFDGFSPSPIPYDIGNIIWHTRNATNPAGAFDGVRIGYGATSAAAWTDLAPGLAAEFDDPPSLTAKITKTGVTLDGKLDEADWAAAPTLVFGKGAFTKKQAGEYSVTGGVDVKSVFDVNGVKYFLPNKDSSLTRVKFLRKGTDLFIGFTSNDKSICKFDWEGDGLFLIIKNSAGVAKQYKLYYQNIDSTANTIRLEEDVLNSSAGAGVLNAGSTVNDTTNVDNGYSAEFRLKLGSLGFDANTQSLQLALSIFDPDGFQRDSKLPWPYGMMPFDSARGSFYKSWWGSEWGDKFRTLTLESDVPKFDDPPSLTVKNTAAAITLDGKLDEADWNGAPTLLFGNGAMLKKQAGDNTVTGEVDVKSAFDVNGVKYFLPNQDSSLTRVKFLRKGTDLYIGFKSNDKSICKFDWEGDGLFLIIKNSAGVTKQFKLYYQNPNDTIRYEEDVLNSGQGAGYLFAGSKVNDTTQVDNGYSGELRVKLGSLGFDANVNAVDVAMSIFDPDGFQHPMSPWDSARGTFYKSWWGSEWGDKFRSLKFLAPYDNPDTMTTVAAAAITLDGKLTEPEWASAPALVFGPPNAPKTGTEKTVTNGTDVKASFLVNGVTYSVPYKDTSYARVKFLQKGMNLYIGISSNDKSICKFDWEGDGMFLMIKNAAGVAKQYKLYYQNLNDTIRYEEDILNSGAGAGSLNAGSKVNDTTQVDNGYTAELMVKLNSLGFDASVKSLQVALNVFDPDGFQHPMAPWDSARGSYYKSWWGSEWGDVMKTIKLQTITGVEGHEAVPIVYALSQNYPNPFNPTTSIKFSVPQSSSVKIVVFDIVGREVATIASGNYAAGYYTVPFNAEHLASGMYMYRMTSTSLSGEQQTFTNTKKLMLVK